jgi:hypothetical protein
VQAKWEDVLIVIEFGRYFSLLVRFNILHNAGVLYNIVYWHQPIPCDGCTLL